MTPGHQSAASPGASRVVAVMTAFHPGESLVGVVDAVLAQVSEVVVVDNTPVDGRGASDVLGVRPGVRILGNGSNVGLATALNEGIEAAGDSEFVFLVDQDSEIPEGMVGSLLGLLDADSRRAIACPAPWDAVEGRYLDPRTPRRPEIAEMAVVITSAMLLRRAAYRQTAGLRDDFFVDGVDQDLCLQLRAAGWVIVQDRRLLFPHSLGETRWHRFGPLRIRATHHPTWRLYWAARNSTILSRDHWRSEPRWSLVNALILGYWMLTVLLFEPPRRRRAGTMLHGIADGVRGRRDDRFLPGSP
ncbi:MAG TPA: glycosyltransferase [Pseudolysinimonas sp.]|jgi:rhamnosyltransferase